MDSELNEQDLDFFQTGDFEVDVGFMEEDVESDQFDPSVDDLEFDANLQISEYIDDNLAMLMTEREVSNRGDLGSMPATNKSLSSIEFLFRSLTGKSVSEVYKECIKNESLRYGGLIGKLLTLVTNTPRMKQGMTNLERAIISQEEDSVSATHSVQTYQDLANLNKEDLQMNIEEIDELLKVVTQQKLKESLIHTRSRYVHLLRALNIPQGDQGVSGISMRDFILWFKNESGFFNDEMNVLFRLQDSALILSIRDRLDSEVELMNERGHISEYEIGLYRESITKVHVTTLFLDVFSSYIKMNLEVGPYSTGTQYHDTLTYSR